MWEHNKVKAVITKVAKEAAVGSTKSGGLTVVRVRTPSNLPVLRKKIGWVARSLGAQGQEYINLVKKIMSQMLIAFNIHNLGDGKTRFPVDFSPFFGG